MTYSEFFRRAFGKHDDPSFAPFHYQMQLAHASWPDLLDVPTGMGKTAAITLAWLWKRGWRREKREVAADTETPRRLVYCLPMRVLVEQTCDIMCTWLDRLGLRGEAGEGKVSLHALMGGADEMKRWAEYPEEDMIILGTQDMLLSRALMRGYGMSRYAWPVHFALLHNDALWVYDEVQLMGAGLPTSAQLEAFRRQFSVARPSRSIWLSATLNPEWLGTVDMKPHVPFLKRQTIDATDSNETRARLNALKSVQRAPFTLSKEATIKKGYSTYLNELCEFVLREHSPESQTLVIVNRVDRAQGLYRLLQQKRASARDLLIHARFRPREREQQARALRNDSGIDRIVVATQAIEAGVDVSSKLLLTELSPWSSMVQRFGRCNRYGEHNETGGARIFWVDVEDHSDAALPYRADDLVHSREKMNTLSDACPSKLPTTDEPRPLAAVLRRKDLLDLFNTDGDLSGFDVDVSDYIRDCDVPSVQVFWRDFTDPQNPQVQSRPVRDELCPVSLTQLENVERRGAWQWDTLQGRWVALDGRPRPGMTLLLRAADGGYDPRFGFDASSRHPVPILPDDSARRTVATFSEDELSHQRVPVMLPDHLAHTAEHARRLCNSVGEDDYAGAIVRACRWHDVGKAHDVFQRSMHCCAEAPVGVLAKSPCRGRHERAFFRHEVVSMLAWLEQNGCESQADLIAYLIAAHHGKVRMNLRAMPSETAPAEIRRFARGVWEGDILPAIEFDGERSNPVTLSLEIMELGLGEHGRSWTERALHLLNQIGPFRLAWLETLVRLSDWRASASEQGSHMQGTVSDE